MQLIDYKRAVYEWVPWHPGRHPCFIRQFRSWSQIPVYSTCTAPALISAVKRAASDLMKPSNFETVPPSTSSPS